MSSTTRRRSTSNAPSGSPAVSPSRNFPCECGREYKHRQSLFTHRKKCTFLLNGGGGEGERPPRSPIPNPRTPRTPARTPRSPARSRAHRSRRHAEGPAQGGDKRLFLKRNLPSLLFLSFVAFASLCWMVHSRGLSQIYELDGLVMLMTALAVLHAELQEPEARPGSRKILLASFLLGLFTETMSIRFGGTHCHASSVANFSQCSSVNSVCYYVPWVYSCIVAGDRLLENSKFSKPLMVGALFFLMCGVYECQGPLMKWWLWPSKDGVVLSGSQLWQYGPSGQDKRGMVVSKHAEEALAQRLYEFPIMAPFFHFAFGWGISFSLLWAQSPIVSVLLGPALGLLWDPVVRVVNILFSTSNTSSAPAVMLVATTMALFTVPQMRRPRKDALLFAIPLANQLYFSYNALLGRGAGTLPAELKLFVAAVAVLALCINARAAGLLCFDNSALRTSFLDQLQKDAQASELEPTNTHPSIFLALALVQTPACMLLADIFGLPSHFAWAPILSHFVGFLLSMITKSAWFFDGWGEVTFLSGILYCHQTSFAINTKRQILVTTLACVWVVRLGTFLVRRILERGRDWRFDKLVTSPAYNLFGWISQGTWVFLNGACLWKLAQAPYQSPLGALDYFGAFLFVVGLSIEHLADSQKSEWNKQNESDMQTTWIEEGLWKFSRHPNYFGEMLLWAGLGLICGGGVLPTFGWRGAAVALISPVWSAFFLIFTSLMLLEKRLDHKFEANPEYQAYKHRVSVLLPWPRA